LFNCPLANLPTRQLTYSKRILSCIFLINIMAYQIGSHRINYQYNYSLPGALLGMLGRGPQHSRKCLWSCHRSWHRHSWRLQCHHLKKRKLWV
jgi:hypothetical protein